MAENWILQALEKKEKIMGFGHRVYRKGDSIPSETLFSKY